MQGFRSYNMWVGDCPIDEANVRKWSSIHVVKEDIYEYWVASTCGLRFAQVRNVVTRSLKCSDTSRIMLFGGERFTGLLKAATEQLPPTAARQMWNCQRRAKNVSGPPMHAGDSACLEPFNTRKAGRLQGAQGYEDKYFSSCNLSSSTSFLLSSCFSSSSASLSPTLSSTSSLLCCSSPYLHVLSSVLYLDFTLLFLRFPLSLLLFFWFRDACIPWCFLFCIFSFPHSFLFVFFVSILLYLPFPSRSLFPIYSCYFYLYSSLPPPTRVVFSNTTNW